LKKGEKAGRKEGEKGRAYRNRETSKETGGGGESRQARGKKEPNLLQRRPRKESPLLREGERGRTDPRSV